MQGSRPIIDSNPASHLVGSYPKHNAGQLNQVNLTKCVTTAELDFTQGTSGGYIEEPTVGKTLALSATLIAKYARFFA